MFPAEGSDSVFFARPVRGLIIKFFSGQWMRSAFLKERTRSQLIARAHEHLYQTRHIRAPLACQCAARNGGNAVALKISNTKHCAEFVWE